MVIQRLQSLFLLIAGIVLAIMCVWVPVGIIQNDAPQHDFIYVSDFLPLLILNVLAAVLLIVDIFLFKNLKLQMQVTKLIMWLVVASMVIGCFVLCCRMPAGAEVIWVGITLLMVLVLVLTYLALRRMRADHKLLNSYNRLR